MNQALVDRIVQAVLYEGYILYPYRPSVKNQQRWTFGGLYPQAYSIAQRGAEAWTMQAECLIHGNHQTLLEVRLRFLHLMARAVGELEHPLEELPQGVEPPYRIVQSLQIGQARFQTWQEAVEREVALEPLQMGSLMAGPLQRSFRFSGSHTLEPLRDPAGRIMGLFVREQQAIEGGVEISAEAKNEDLFKVTVVIRNNTPLDHAEQATRDEALLRSLVSTHMVLHVRQGEFISLMDPPAQWRAAVAECRNVGSWPVLVGEVGEKDTMLCSPIILYDYPQIAPESPGDLFDATEIDELLSLRIMTLTPEEKQVVAGVDERARALLDRTEALARGELAQLHGAIRDPQPMPPGGTP